MILYFADRSFNILGHADTALPKGRKVIDDEYTEELNTGGNTLSLVVIADDTGESFEKTRKMYDTGNFILMNNSEDTDFFTIIDSDYDGENNTFEIYAEAEGLNLLNTIVGPYTADKAYPIKHYIDMFAKDSGFEIGVNELSNNERTLSWEGEDNATARLLSVANKFDGELKYRFDIVGLTVRHKYIDIYKKVGERTSYLLYKGKDVKDIHWHKTIENLATALDVTGGTPEPSDTNPEIEAPPITLEGYTYDDGDFYVDGKFLKSREALKKWTRKKWETLPGEGHIIQPYSYDTLDQKILCNMAIAKLKNIREPEIEYEIEMEETNKNLRVGDTALVIDSLRNIYIKGRIYKKTVSDAENTKTLFIKEDN